MCSNPKCPITDAVIQGSNAVQRSIVEYIAATNHTITLSTMFGAITAAYMVFATRECKEQFTNPEDIQRYLADPMVRERFMNAILAFWDHTEAIPKEAGVINTKQPS